VLYTDGLVEERTRPIDEGLNRLQSVVHSLTGLPVEDTCEAISLAMFANRMRTDDVCLLVARPQP
jgi:serine phosphatase RsbU (regulator of sigma subunit)